MSKLRIIGDVHGKWKEYLNIIKDCDYSIQVGDLGFDYEFLKDVDYTKHIIVPGNHDNYDKVVDYDHILHGYGEYSLGGFDFFFVRGAFSIDWYQRLQKHRNGGQKTWWEDEELRIDQLKNAIQLYVAAKPQFVISHDCPKAVGKFVSKDSVLEMFGYHPATFTTNTQQALSLMYNYHKPKNWVFGHYHVSKKFNIQGMNTNFHCLAELEYIELDI